MTPGFLKLTFGVNFGRQYFKIILASNLPLLS
jgi:hypothetical protein